MKIMKKQRFAVKLAAMLFASAAVLTVEPVYAAEVSQEHVSKPSTTSVSIDEKHFPDKNFRQFVKAQFDTDEDGVLSEGEISLVTALNIQYEKENGVVIWKGHTLDYVYKNDRDTYDGISMDFTGLEIFSSLKYLGIKNIEANNLQLEKLPELSQVNFAAMPKTAFDFTNCLALQEVGIINTPLEYLYVNKSNLTCLIATNCQLKEIDLSSCRGLCDILLSDNKLTDVKVPEKNYSGEDWDFSNNQLTHLDLSNTFPEEVDISGNPFNEINSDTLKADGAVISGLLASKLTKCKSFDVSHMRGLERLTASQSLTEAIKIGQQLKELRLSNLDHISVIDKTTIQAPADNKLEFLEVNNCTLTKLSTSQFSNLRELKAVGNQLLHLNISGNKKLSMLSLWDKTRGGNENLTTMIVDRSISKACMDELNLVVKKTGGKITYLPQKVTGLKAIHKTSTTLKLTFHAVPGASGYKIYDAVTGKCLSSASTQNGAKEICKTITGLKAGEKRQYRVRAYVTIKGTKHYGKYSEIYTKSTGK